jgi:hypothetical protein
MQVDWKLHRHMCLRKKDTCAMCGKKKGLNSSFGCFQHMYCSAD